MAVRADGLRCDSVVLLEQIRTLDKSRLGVRLARLDKETMGRIDRAMIASFGMEHTL